MSRQYSDEDKDRRALEALAILAQAITEAATRRRFQENPRDAIEEALAKDGRSIGDLPDDVVAFFEKLSKEELKTLADLQETMAGIRDKGFPSLSEVVEVNPSYTLGKL
jgi:hypothetical protein